MTVKFFYVALSLLMHVYFLFPYTRQIRAPSCAGVFPERHSRDRMLQAIAPVCAAGSQASQNKGRQPRWSFDDSPAQVFPFNNCYPAVNIYRPHALASTWRNLFSKRSRDDAGTLGYGQKAMVCGCRSVGKPGKLGLNIYRLRLWGLPPALCPLRHFHPHASFLQLFIRVRCWGGRFAEERCHR